MNGLARSACALRFALAYALLTLPMFAAWELAHAPLYTLWVERGAAAGVRAALHCTLGDALIAGSSALAGVVATAAVPALRTCGRMAASVLAVGMLATMVIEWISVYQLGRWAYRESMPLVFGIGLSPLLQWTVVPGIGMWWMRRLGMCRALALSNATP